MSQKLASHQIPTGPVVGLLLRGSIMVKGREATCTCTTPIFFNLWASLLAPQIWLREGEVVGRAVPAEMRPAPYRHSCPCPVPQRGPALPSLLPLPEPTPDGLMSLIKS